MKGDWGEAGIMSVIEQTTMDERRAAGRAPADWRTRISRYGALVVLVLLAGTLSLANPMFLSPYNLQTILDLTATLLMVSLGQTFVIMLGGIDLSSGAIVSIVSVVFALAVSRWGAWAFLLAAGAGALAGLINGLIFTRARIPSFIATLGTSGIFLSLAYLFSGGAPVQIKPSAFAYLDLVTGRTLGVSRVYWIAGLVFLVFFLLQRFTPMGRYMLAVGSAERVAFISGAPIERVKTAAMFISGLTSGLAGILLASTLFSGTPGLGLPYQLQSIATVVVGGTALTGGVGGLGQTLVGAVIMSMLSNGMNVAGVNIYAQQIVTGMVVIGGVALTLDRGKIPVIK